MPFRQFILCRIRKNRKEAKFCCRQCSVHAQFYLCLQATVVTPCKFSIEVKKQDMNADCLTNRKLTNYDIFAQRMLIICMVYFLL